jgi:hypothetical protein
MSRLPTAVLFVVLVAATATNAERPSAEIKDLPACGPRPALAPAGLKDQPMGETFSLSLPPSCEREAGARFAHGGDRWRCGAVTVEVAWGMWGRSSFGDGSKVCRTDVAGTLVMVVRDPSDTGRVSVWYPTGEIHEPLVSVSSKRVEDGALVEAIAFSGRVHRPH